jgi:GH25 family lysozyme M1 (1,4-beta-N-acetylmuramidase)
MTVYGADLSDFDYGRGPVDVGSMARDGIEFVTAKATEGTRTIHTQYGNTMGKARAAGIRYLGAYVVPRTPGNLGHGSVAAQASFFLDYVNQRTPWWRDWPGWFFQVDLEKWSNQNGVYDAVSPATGLEMCRLLREQTGRRVVLYAPSWAYGNGITGTDPLWASSYGTNPVAHYRAAYPGDSSSRWGAYSGRSPAILQYGSRLTIGSQPGCDANAFRGTTADFHRFITGQELPLATNDQLLNGWNQPVVSDGSPDNRGVGVWVAEGWRYLWDGKGAYDKGSADPAGPPSGFYLDRLLKLIRDDVRELKERPTASMTDEQVAALGLQVAAAVTTALGAGPITTEQVSAAVKTALAGLTLRAS